MFCSQCGKIIEDNEKFCRHCGKKLIINCSMKRHNKSRGIQLRWMVGTIIGLLLIFTIKWVINEVIINIAKGTVSVVGTYYGSYENCNGKMPLGIDDNIWGMTKEEFEKYSGILLEEDAGLMQDMCVGYDLPFQYGEGYTTGWGSYVVFLDGYGLSMIVLDAGTNSAYDAQLDLPGEMLIWLEKYGTYTAKTKNNQFILYELDKSYALLQNFYLQSKRNNTMNSSIYICYVSKDVQRAGNNYVYDIDELIEKSIRQNNKEKGVPLIEIFYEDLLMLTIYSEDIKVKDIEVLTSKENAKTEYAVRIQLQPAKADELKELTYQYAFKNIEILTLRTEAEEIEVSTVITEGEICIAWFEEKEAAERYAEWLRKEINE